MPPILDVAIGAVFVFLLFSLVVSALNEAILSAFDSRAAFLKEGLREIFRDSGGSAGVGPLLTLEAFLKHGMISVLSRGVPKAGADALAVTPTGWRASLRGWFVSPRSCAEGMTAADTAGVPSYVPGKSFVLALLSLITEGKQPPAEGKDLRAAIESIANVELKSTLLSLHDDAQGDLERFKANIENWFNESMDRVGGWYKRYAQKWLLGLGFLLAVVCNVDSVRIIHALSADSKLRESMVAQAERYSSEMTASGAAPTADEKIQQFKDRLADLGGTGVPIGWGDGVARRLWTFPPDHRDVLIGAWLSALAGWIITALAASLGAPFWFDLLGRIVDIRAVGRAPEEKDPTSPKKKASSSESYVKAGDAQPAA